MRAGQVVAPPEFLMTSPYRASLNSSLRMFTFLLIILTRNSIRKAKAAELGDLIKNSNAASPKELGLIVRNSLMDLANRLHADGITHTTDARIFGTIHGTGAFPDEE